MLDRLNPTVIGCALNVIGLFFLASAISFKQPRRQIEELLGLERSRSLLLVREHLVNQIQTYLGFGILVIGFVLLMGEALERTRPVGAEGSDPHLVWIVALLTVAMLGTTAALKLIKEGYVRSKFRRLLREVVRDSKFNLEKSPQLAVQIGELLHIPKGADESVAEYIGKVRAVLGLAPLGSGGAGLSGGLRPRPTK
ncbi:MAG: hypothetical protein EXS13_07495 [Planctomycetes bacterium]|nr:hypothetical protein [Planctomycetota bacterium]